mmetsp:Transcript_17036/g.41052  ORF Transcript_17036/g.41052 Transcript_17036/m.41052 type:complete len:157 (+) Transcript_17036:65-535(+)
MEPTIDPAVIAAAREKLMKKGPAAQLGGAGTARRKQKKVHKPVSVDDKKLMAALKKIGCNPIPGIEEVNMFKTDGKVIHFSNPKVQAAIGANTYAVSGNGEEKQLQELLPGIINQMGMDNLAGLKKLAEQMAAQEGKADDDVPDLGGENFEDVSKD